MLDAGHAALIVGNNSAATTAIVKALAADLRVAHRGDVPWPSELSDDLSSSAQALEDYWRVMVFDFLRLHRRLDVLVTVLPGASAAGIRDLSLSTFHRHQLRQIVHPWLGLKHASVAMKTTGGTIITVGDLAPSGGDVFRATAARALANMMGAMALEVGGATSAIRVNWVEAHSSASQPNQVAAAVKLLASPRSSFMTGTKLVLSASNGR